MLIAEAVTIVFLLLKVTSIITWSWLWIFSPMFIVYGSILLMMLIVVVGYLIVLAVIIGMDKYHDWSVSKAKKKKKSQ